MAANVLFAGFHAGPLRTVRVRGRVTMLEIGEQILRELGTTFGDQPCQAKEAVQAFRAIVKEISLLVDTVLPASEPRAIPVEEVRASS